MMWNYLSEEESLISSYALWAQYLNFYCIISPVRIQVYWYLLPECHVVMSADSLSWCNISQYQHEPFVSAPDPGAHHCHHYWYVTVTSLNTEIQIQTFIDINKHFPSSIPKRQKFQIEILNFKYFKIEFRHQQSLSNFLTLM